MLDAQMLEVSLLESENGASCRKRCVVNGRMTKVCNKVSTPPAHTHTYIYIYIYVYICILGKTKITLQL